MAGVSRAFFDATQSYLEQRFPELQVGSAGDVFEVDRARRAVGAPPTTLGQATENAYIWSSDDEALGASRGAENVEPERPGFFSGLGTAALHAALPFTNIPEAYRGFQQTQQGLLGFFTGGTPQESLSRAGRGLLGQEQFRSADVGFARLLPEGRTRDVAGEAIFQAVNPTNYLGGAGGFGRGAIAAQSALGGAGSKFFEGVAEDAGLPEWARTAASLAGGVGGASAATAGARALAYRGLGGGMGPRLPSPSPHRIPLPAMVEGGIPEGAGAFDLSGIMSNARKLMRKAKGFDRNQIRRATADIERTLSDYKSALDRGVDAPIPALADSTLEVMRGAGLGDFADQFKSRDELIRESLRSRPALSVEAPSSEGAVGAVAPAASEAGGGGRYRSRVGRSLPGAGPSLPGVKQTIPVEGRYRGGGTPADYRKLQRNIEDLLRPIDEPPPPMPTFAEGTGKRSRIAPRLPGLPTLPVDLTDIPESGIYRGVSTPPEFAQLQKHIQDVISPPSAPTVTRWERAIDALGVARSLKATADLSATLRHGLVPSTLHPVLAGQSFLKEVRAAFSHNYAVDLDNAIHADPVTKLLVDNGAYFAPVEAARSGLSKREEEFASALAERIPGIGRIIKGADRAFATYLNNLRYGVAKKVMANWSHEDYTPENLGKLASWLNHSTGRGDLKFLNDIAPAMNVAFFSPRYAVSRVQMTADMARALGSVAKATAKREAVDPISKEIALNAVAFYGTGLTVLGLMGMAGLRVGVDPRASNFGKVRIGHTEYDMWGGLAQDARFIAQIVKGARVNPETGMVTDQNVIETTKRFLRSKLAPIPGVLTDIAVGYTQQGKPATLTNSAINLVAPIVATDIVAAWQADKLGGVIGVAPASILGIGTNTQVPSALEAQAEQMFPGRTLRDLSPTQREAVQLANPAAAEDTANEIRVSGTTAATALRVKEHYTELQNNLDQQLRAGTIDPKTWRDRRGSLIDQASGALYAAYLDNPRRQPDPSRPWEVYGKKIADEKEAGGGFVDAEGWARIEAWRATLTSAQNEAIDRESGIGSTQLDRKYRADMKKIAASGYFDLRDEIVRRETGDPADTWASLVAELRRDELVQARVDLENEDPEWHRHDPTLDRQLMEARVRKKLASFSARKITPVQQRWRALPENQDEAQLLREWGLAGTGMKETLGGIATALQGQ